MARSSSGSTSLCGRISKNGLLAMNALGFHLADRHDLARVPRQVLGQSLRRIGHRRGDVLSIETPAGEAHHEIAPATQPE